MSLQTERDGAVEVLHEGRWLRGRLLHTYRQPNGRWRGIVRYTAGVGEQYEQGRDQNDIRKAQAGTLLEASERPREADVFA